MDRRSRDGHQGVPGARNQAATATPAEAPRWKELAKKAELLQAQVAERARTGADLFQSEQIGLDCLDRHAEEREALRASLETAVADPAAYAESLRLAATIAGSSCAQISPRSLRRAGPSPFERGGVSRPRTGGSSIESEAVRTLADPTLRAAEA